MKRTEIYDLRVTVRINHKIGKGSHAGILTPEDFNEVASEAINELSFKAYIEACVHNALGEYFDSTDYSVEVRHIPRSRP